VKSLPRKPDIVLSKYKTVIFVNGCFNARFDEIIILNQNYKGIESSFPKEHQPIMHIH